MRPNCLNCGEMIWGLEGAPGNDGMRGPEVGDFMVCGLCGFAQALSQDGLRHLTPREKRFVAAMRKRHGIEISRH